LNGKFRIPGKYALFLMLLPFLLLVVVFSYLPLYGWIYSFFDYRPGFKLTADRFVGLRWFSILLTTSAQKTELVRVMKNTLGMSFLGIAFSWLPLAFAVLLNEVNLKGYKKLVQTATTIPNFISWVLVYSFAFMLFSVDSGFFNKLFKNLGFIEKDINFLFSDRNVWFSMLLWGIWKGLGWGAIMYLAAIASIDQELYEAARVDGARRFHLMRYITMFNLHLTNNFLAYLLPFIVSPFYIILVKTYIESIPSSLEEAAVMDGAGYLKRFRSVILPLAFPILATVAIFSSVNQ
jgi:putative aldouronate transport system permease protein